MKHSKTAIMHNQYAAVIGILACVFPYKVRLQRDKGPYPLYPFKLYLLVFSLRKPAISRFGLPHVLVWNHAGTGKTIDSLGKRMI